MNNWLHNIDFFISIRSDILTPSIKAITLLGDSNFLLLLLPVGYWIFGKNVFSRWGLLVLLNVLLMAYLKDLFKDPRPDGVLQLDHSVNGSYGFPSGHAQLAVVSWLWIAWEVRKRWVWILCSSLIIGICFSRLYLGVHDLEDIIGGVVIGLLTILIFALLTSQKFKCTINIRPFSQILAIAAIEIFFIITWPGKVPAGVIWIALFFIGFLLGVNIENKYINFKRHDNWIKIGASGVIGIIIYLFLRLALQIILEHFVPSITLISSIHALICGVYITVFAPYIFQRIHLANKRGLVSKDEVLNKLSDC